MFSNANRMKPIISNGTFKARITKAQSSMRSKRPLSVSFFRISCSAFVSTKRCITSAKSSNSSSPSPRSISVAISATVVSETSRPASNMSSPRCSILINPC